MNKEQDHISELIQELNRVLAARSRTLTDVEVCILEQALSGKRLKEIRVSGYSENTVQRDFCPKLWELLSSVVGQKVRINTVRLNLEKLLQTDRAKNAEAERSTVQPEATSNVTILVERSDRSRSIRHNLPSPTCTTFIGREAEVARLLELISPKHAAHLISVDGIGGVGKTSLVVECAYRCLRASGDRSSSAPTFELILFTSAKEFHLKPFGLLESWSPQRSLRDIFQQIAQQLEEVDLTGLGLKEQGNLIKQALADQQTLLIVDNLETVEDQHSVLSFLNDLPPAVKVVMTTREQIVFVPVRLTSMPELDALQLIQHEADEKGVFLSPLDCHTLYQHTGGIPVAIHYAIGQIASGYLIQDVMERLSQATGDVARFCFESSVQPIRGQPAHQLLMALALFSAPALQAMLTDVGTPDADQQTIQQALARLRGLSLVRQTDKRYSMLPLTREYALSELKALPEFEQDARDRWVNGYLSFSKPYADQDPEDWRGQFDGLAEEWQNLQAIADWCMAQNRYGEMLQLWQNIESSIYAMGRRISRIGYWDDSLVWTNWLIQAAFNRGDWAVAAKVMQKRSWMLTAIGKPLQLQEAERLLEQAWNLRHHQDLPFQSNLARQIGVLCLQQQQFHEAQTWLSQATDLLQQAQPQRDDRLRQLLTIRYYQGRVSYQLKEFEQAKVFFETAREYAQVICRERAVAMCENWLAEIAIQQGDLDAAERLLMQGLSSAEHNSDVSRTAYTKRSLSNLARTRGNVSEAYRWATEACLLFERLGMALEVEETQSVIEDIAILSQS
jgi:tetratricopeptide (TPR) repeat protein